MKKIGYLSCTFDLFQIGNLDLLERAKNYCDYLIVGVNRNIDNTNIETVIPFKERISIIKAVKFVDKVVES